MFLKDAYLYSWVVTLRLFFVGKLCTPMGFQSNSTLDEQALRWSTAGVRKDVDKSVILFSIICFVQYPVWESQEIKIHSGTFI